MPKIVYPRKGGRELPAKYKSTFRSLLPEINSLLKMNRKDKWTEKTLIHNIVTVVVWRIMDRDKKYNEQIRRLRKSLNILL